MKKNCFLILNDATRVGMIKNQPTATLWIDSKIVVSCKGKNLEKVVRELEVFVRRLTCLRTVLFLVVVCNAAQDCWGERRYPCGQGHTHLCINFLSRSKESFIRRFFYT